MEVNYTGKKKCKSLINIMTDLTDINRQAHLMLSILIQRHLLSFIYLKVLYTIYYYGKEALHKIGEQKGPELKGVFLTPLLWAT